MQTVEVRSLLNESIREIRVEEPMLHTFGTWYEMFVKKTNREPTLMDVFYAGYILSNPNVRDLFKLQIKEKRKNDYS